MINSSRRTILTTGAAAAATAAAPQVFAQAPQTSVPQGAPAGAKTGYYEKGNVRIRYTEIRRIGRINQRHSPLCRAPASVLG